MPLVQTRGAASAQGFGEFAQASGPANYIEDVFSTYLYTGTGATQTITNNIDLSTYGGLVWFKPRDTGNNHNLIDSARGLTKFLLSNATNANGTAGAGYGVTSFNTTGFTLGNPWTSSTNTTSTNYASWTFRKQPKFFDVVTYTGTGSNTTIAHNLGAVPGCIIVKRTDTTADWAVYHRSLANTQYLVLNDTAAAATGATWWNSTTPTSSVFSVGTDASVNASGGTYVAYVFAHNAGGFGLTGTDNVISCGSYTGTGAVGNSVTLGYEPQWLMVKNVTSSNYWVIYDNMRGMPASDTNTGNTKFLRPNTSDAEAGGITIAPTATGFQVNTGGAAVNTTGDSYIYIAIRRGPMKVPTDGTKVYGAVSRAGTGANATVTTGSFPPDLTIIRGRDAGFSWRWGDRLRGTPVVLRSNLTNAELTGEADLSSFNMNGFSLTGTGASLSNDPGNNYINYAMGRAPSFFDEVCYTNTGSSQQVAFTTLGTTPELVIYKARGTTSDWYVLAKAGAVYHGLKLNTTAASAFNDTAANLGITSTYFDPAFGWGGPSSFTYAAYFFASAPGVSKCGSYTGNGTTQTINCGFAGGARFVLIKRTDSTGDWYVYDTARGMTTLTDPYLLLNSTAAESATLGSVTTVTTGFAVNASILAAINTNAASYIFLAIS